MKSVLNLNIVNAEMENPKIDVPIRDIPLKSLVENLTSHCSITPPGLWTGSNRFKAAFLNSLKP
jgi:hypothetical protein